MVACRRTSLIDSECFDYLYCNSDWLLLTNGGTVTTKLNRFYAFDSINNFNIFSLCISGRFTFASGLSFKGVK